MTNFDTDEGKNFHNFLSHHQHQIGAFGLHTDALQPAPLQIKLYSTEERERERNSLTFGMDVLDHFTERLELASSSP
jgi:hypothetical protein